jgi:hypothetical protein
MRRLGALLFGAIAGLAAVKFVRRRADDATADSESDKHDGEETKEGQTANEQASRLRRTLDEARDRSGKDSGGSVDPGADDSIGEARQAEDDERDSESASSGPDGGVEELSERRARVHGRARDAAESMRPNGGSGAA